MPTEHQAATPSTGAKDARTNGLLWALLVILLMSSAVVLVVKLDPLRVPRPVELVGPDPGCDLAQAPCTARLADGTVLSFGITPLGIPLVTPLTLTVSVEGLAVSAVEVDFAGVDMNMGFNRVALTRLADGRFAGQGMLPVCVRERMTWEARVLLQAPGGLRAAAVRFDTTR